MKSNGTANYLIIAPMGSHTLSVVCAQPIDPAMLALPSNRCCKKATRNEQKKATATTATEEKKTIPTIRRT